MKRALLLLFLLLMLVVAPVQAQVNVTLTPTPKVQWLDLNGDPLASGHVHAYISGTTTDQATYTDSTGAVANANPVVLDAAGRAEIWLEDGLAYTLALHDSSNALVWSVDGVTGEALDTNLVVGTTAVTFTSTPTFDSSSSVLFTMTLTGNVTSSTISNATDGRVVYFNICQDSTGGRTFVWDALVLTAPTIGRTASSCTSASLIYDGTNWRELGEASRSTAVVEVDLTHDTSTAASTLIAACLADLPSTGGICDATALKGTQLLSTNPFSGISTPFTLLLGSATFGTSVRLAITDADNWKILGNGTTIFDFTAASPNSDLTLLGTIDNFEIAGINFQGTDTIAHQQRGIGSTSNASLAVTDGWIHDNTFTDLKIGVTLNADSAGFYRDILIENNSFIHIIGTSSGEGYGINNGGTNNENIRIINNYFERNQRHSIYQARGRQVVISGNNIIDHADETASSTALHAIKVARSTDVNVTNNTLENCSNGNILVTSGAVATYNILVASNNIKSPVGRYAIEVGLDGSSDAFLEKVTVSENQIYTNVTTTSSDVNLIRVNWGLRIKIENNYLYLLNSTATIDMMVLDAEGTVNTDSGDYEISRNWLYGTENGGTTRGIRLTTALATNNTDLDLHFNKINVPTASNAISEASTLTNTNLTLIGSPLGGLTTTTLKALTSGPINPAVTGLDLGSASLRWDAFLETVLASPLEDTLSNLPHWILKVVDHTDMTAGATADTFTLWTLPANTMIYDVIGNVVTGWSGGSISAAVCSVGTNAGAANDLTLDDNFFAAAAVYELHDATASGGKGALLFDATDKFAPHFFVAGGVIEIQCDLTGDNHANATAGQAQIWIEVSQPFANTTTEAN